jgi:hypothetical protein
MLDARGWVLVVEVRWVVLNMLLLLLLELVEDGEGGGVLEEEVTEHLVEGIRRKLGERGVGVGVHPLRRRRAGAGGGCRSSPMPRQSGSAGVVALAVAGAIPLMLLITAGHLCGRLEPEWWRRRGRGGAWRRVGARLPCGRFGSLILYAFSS